MKDKIIKLIEKKIAHHRGLHLQYNHLSAKYPDDTMMQQDDYAQYIIKVTLEELLEEIEELHEQSNQEIDLGDNTRLYKG